MGHLIAKPRRLTVMSGEVQIRFPPQFSHSVKIDQTAKGAQISVHVYSNSQEDVINQAVQMCQEVKKRLEQEGHAIAPIESGAIVAEPA